MKQGKRFITIISVILLVFLCVISKDAGIKYILAGMIYGNSSDIIFSRESGFYDDEFELLIFAPTDEVYYTLDGSDPDRNSLKYETPLNISDASDNPNVYSMRTDVTTRFSDKITEEQVDMSGEPVYVVPVNNVEKCNVVKAVYYDQQGRKSRIEERVYFIDYDSKSGYEDINIISITTAPQNLFDYENGIYVTGRNFDAYCEEGIPEGKLDNWEHWEANYSQRGREWERECSIQVFDTEKNNVLSQNAGLRIQGGASRGFLPKSLNLYAREEYGNNRLEYDFFGNGYTPKRITLTSSGQDYYTKIKDRLISELSEECNIATMNYEPYALFLNGEYWGFYYLTEKYDAQYIEYYYGVDRGAAEENIIMIKAGEIEAGKPEDEYELYDKMVEFISDNDMSMKENYEKACTLIDIDSFIDYFAVESYIARCGDWPKGNYALWRSRNISDQSYEDGKWRWMLFDVNSTAMRSWYPEFDYIEENRKDSKMFDSLCENEEFKYKFSNRIIELTNTIYTKENVNQKIDEYVQLMQEPMENHFKRFFGTSNDLFYSEVEDLKCFFNERGQYIAEIIKNHFGEEYLGDNK